MTYNPWLDVARRYPDIHIEWHPIAPARAFWCPEQRVIIVDETISRAERRCALAHEVAHVDCQDRPTGECWFGGRQESKAHRLAAARLVDLDDLAAAVRWCADPREVAEALDVTVKVLALRVATMTDEEREHVDRIVDQHEGAA